mmetsp:Transcript_63951/g.73367  ORF Transcript_63951/g.73367 Transcript_63951/m.73367 type:complete len:220 (-) Transcript_63951:121-780(-)
MEVQENSTNTAGLLLELSQCGLVVEDQVSIRPGCLSVLSQTIIWTSSDGIEFNLAHNQISMHGISRNPPFGKAAIVCHLTNSQDIDGKGDQVTSLYFVPQDDSSVQSLFDALNKGADMNPDGDCGDHYEYSLQVESESEYNQKCEDILEKYEANIEFHDMTGTDSTQNGEKGQELNLQDYIIDPNQLVGLNAYNPEEEEEEDPHHLDNVEDEEMEEPKS